MKSFSKSAAKRANEKRVSLDMNAPATATAFRDAAKAYTKRATKSKAQAIKTLQREGFLNKHGELAKPYR